MLKEIQKLGRWLDGWLDDHWVWLWLSPIALLAIAAGGAIVLKALGI